MIEPIIVETKSTNNNPWWVAYHASLQTYEVQINQKTKNVLIGEGPIFTSNIVLSCSDLLRDEYWLKYIRTNLTSEVVEQVIMECKELCQ